MISSRSRATLTVLFAVVVVFGAGLAVGRLRWQAPSDASWLGQELDLSASQRQQMREIWSPVVDAAPADQQMLQAIEHDRDRQVQALLSPAQRTRYEQVLSESDAKLAAVHQRMTQRVENARQRTRQLLTDPQRARFEAILQTHSGFTDNKTISW